LIVGAATSTLQGDEKTASADQQKVQALINDLKSTDNNVRLKAVAALADFGPGAEPAVPALTDALQVKNEDLRLNAAMTLGKVGKVAIPAIGKLLDSTDDDTRYYAIWSIGWMGPEAKGAAGVVIQALADKNDGVRRKAATRWGGLRRTRKPPSPR
jgi:HEAT repeat protein